MEKSIIRILILPLLIFQFGACSLGQAPSHPQPETKGVYGTLSVEATWDDTRATPATNIYVEAHGFVKSVGASRSFVLVSVLPGKYQMKVPPAVYDVFISDGISIPVCKRVLVTSGSTVSWKVRLEGDEKYTLK